MNLQKNHNIRGMGEKYSKRCVLQATKSLETNTLKVQSNVEMGTILINKSCPVTDHNKVKKKKNTYAQGETVGLERLQALCDF